MNVYMCRAHIIKKIFNVGHLATHLTENWIFFTQRGVVNKCL